jgi:hypothetical protein
VEITLSVSSLAALTVFNSRSEAARLLFISFTAEAGFSYQTVDIACKWVKPITLTKYEIKLIEEGEISPETAKMILAHNRAYKANCSKNK